MAAFHKIKEAFTPDVRDYVAFFVGAQNYDAYKAAYNDLWSNRQAKFDHRYFRPWYDTSYRLGKGGQVYQPTSGGGMASISQKHRVKKEVYCNKCAKSHEFEFALGAILKLVLRVISRDEWC
jgi:hypothetical protein